MQNPFIQAAINAAKKPERASSLVATAILDGDLRRYSMDWRAMERNKYAPWGRGKNYKAS